MRRVSLVQVSLVVAMLSLLASVTAPALRQRLEVTRTSEAVLRLADIARRSATYYVSPEQPPGLRAFPPSASATPSAPPRAASTALAAEMWSQPGWRAMGFAPTDLSYFSYSFESNGVGSDARFVARAEGDLDGDGERSTFEREGRARPDGTVDLSSGLWVNHPLE